MAVKVLKVKVKKTINGECARRINIDGASKYYLHLFIRVIVLTVKLFYTHQYIYYIYYKLLYFKNCYFTSSLSPELHHIVCGRF